VPVDFLLDWVARGALVFVAILAIWILVREIDARIE